MPQFQRFHTKNEYDYYWTSEMQCYYTWFCYDLMTSNGLLTALVVRGQITVLDLRVEHETRGACRLVGSALLEKSNS